MATADDRRALEEFRRVSEPGNEHEVLHYLYFPTKGKAAKVARIITKQGYKAEHQKGADGVSWLVLVKHRMIPDEQVIEGMRTAFEALATRYRGEYDGWEIDTTPLKSFVSLVYGEDTKPNRGST